MCGDHKIKPQYVNSDRRRGQSLMELLVGIALGAVFIIGAAVIIVPSLQTNKQVASIQIQAQLASGLLNNVEAWGTGNWNNLLALATGTGNPYYLNTSSSPFIVVASGTVLYAYRRAITVTSTTSIASGTNTNFPMLFSGTYSWLEASSSGGMIQNLVTAPNGGQEPADLIFTSDSGCSSPLNFETESYSSSTGALVDWVNVPSLAAGSVIYACYGNSSVTTDQSHPSSVWNSNYAGVWHNNQNPSGIAPQMIDSTGNSYDGTASGTWTSTQQTPGQIDGALNFLSANNDVIGYGTAAALSPSNFSLSAWIDPTGTAQQMIFDHGKGCVVWDSHFLSIGGSENDEAPGKLSVGFRTSNASANSQVDSTSNVATAMQYVVGTYNGSTLSIYINGILNNTASASGVPYSDGQQLYAGADPGCGGRFQFNGIIDEERVANVALSPSWILTEYNNQNSPSTFYGIGPQVTINSGGGTTGIQSIVVNGVTYQRYFYLTDVYRDSNGDPTTVASGNSYDPSTIEVTAAAYVASSTAPPTTYSMFLTRNASNVFNQESWSGGGGYSSAATFVSSTFSNSTNTTVNLQGAFELSAGTGNSCVY